jgi:hypothetical protein
MLARDHARVVILQKSPDFPQCGEVLDLGFRQLAEDDARASVELVVQIQRCPGPLHPGRFPHGFAIHQQLQIVRPDPPGPGDQDAEVQLLRIAMDGQGNRVFRPVMRTLHLALLHVLEGQTWSVAILAHPQS